MSQIQMLVIKVQFNCTNEWSNMSRLKDSALPCTEWAGRLMPIKVAHVTFVRMQTRDVWLVKEDTNFFIFNSYEWIYFFLVETCRWTIIYVLLHLPLHITGNWGNNKIIFCVGCELVFRSKSIIGIVGSDPYGAWMYVLLFSCFAVLSWVFLKALWYLKICLTFCNV